MLNQMLRKAGKLLSRSHQTTRSEFYYNRIYFKRIYFFYNTYKQRKINNKVSSTLETINPLGLKFGDDYNEVMRKFDTYNYIYNNDDNANNHKVLIIREMVGHIGLLIQLQFNNDKLFFIGMDVSKSVRNEVEKSEIINTVIQKYLNKPYRTGDEYPLIEDNAGNFILINEDIYFSICYLDGNAAYLRNHVDAAEGSDKKRITRKDREKLFFTF